MRSISVKLIFVVFMALLFTQCQDDSFVGNGDIMTEERDFESFSALEINGIFDVEILHSDLTGITITGDGNLLEKVITRQDGQRIVIEMEEGNYDEFNISLRINSPKLTDLDITEIGNVLVDGYQDLATLNIDQAGIGDITFSNSSVDILNLDKTGIGQFNGFDLISNTCNVDKSGVGDMEITCTERLTGDLSGVGNIYYKGSPAIEVDRSGLGDVIDAN